MVEIRPQDLKALKGQVAPTNWNDLLHEYGMPPAVVKELDNIWRTSDHNVQNAIPIAQAYVRQTPWYAKTYPGIQVGVKAGLFSDESGYRAYGNQVNQIYKQYYGRSATTAEVGTYVKAGQAASQVAQQFQSQAIAGNLSDPLKKLFTPQELKALSNQQAGIDSALGQAISAKAELAMRVSPLYQDFYGRAPTKAEIDHLTKDGTSPEVIAKNLATQANINAMNPAVKDLFTPDEIKQIALQAAGGSTQFGQRLTDIANLATQLNSAYHTYTGQGVTRDEVNSAYAGGLTAQEVQNRLQTSAISGALPGYLKDIFSTDQLRAAAGATAGSDLSANALRQQSLVNAAPDYNTVVRQYENRNVTADELSGFVDSGKSADTLGKEYAGKGVIAAKGQDYQFALGHDGGGQATPEELAALGNEQAGIDTVLGQQLQERLNKAQQRLAGIAKSTLAKPSLTLSGGRLTSASPKRPDIGA